MSRLNSAPIMGGDILARYAQPGSNITFVSSQAPRSGDANGLRCYPTIKAALQQSRTSERNDVIACLPGHAETIDSAWGTNLRAGTTILGLGDANMDNSPTLTWNATGSTIAVDVDNVRFINLRMKSTANGVAEGFGVTGDFFHLISCYVQLATSATDEFTQFLDLEASADDCLIQGNRMFGVTGPSAGVIDISGASARQRILDNFIDYVGDSTTGGGIDITSGSAVTSIEIAGNVVMNRVASSISCIRISDQAHTGAVHHNYCGNLTDGIGGISLVGTTNVLLDFFENYSCDDEKGKSALLSPAAQT